MTDARITLANLRCAATPDESVALAPGTVGRAGTRPELIAETPPDSA